MRDAIRFLLTHPEQAQHMAAHGLRTIASRHTCAHRVDELLELVEELNTGSHPDLRAEIGQ
jgi:spore maturation protein CgeB